MRTHAVRSSEHQSMQLFGPVAQRAQNKPRPIAFSNRCDQGVVGSFVLGDDAGDGIDKLRRNIGIEANRRGKVGEPIEEEPVDYTELTGYGYYAMVIKQIRSDIPVYLVKTMVPSLSV